LQFEHGNCHDTLRSLCTWHPKSNGPIKLEWEH
jgi:hypothetical protein